MDKIKGCYCLIINLEKNCNIKIGKLGNVKFIKGTYVYVGSAMNSLISRLNRHLSDDKKLHWHIDYFLKNKNAKVINILFNISSKKIECELSRTIQDNNGIENFGCSDCKCNSHLYFFKNENVAIKSVKNAYKSIKAEYHDINYFKKYLKEVKN